MPILMSAMKAILCRLKICQMVCMFQAEGHEVVLQSFAQYTEKLVSTICKRCNNRWFLWYMLCIVLILGGKL